MSDREEQAKKLTAAIAGLEAQRAALGDAVVEPALAALRDQLSELNASPRVGAAGDERKIVTVVFADITGFTALAEKLDGEEVRTLINACFECLVPIVQKYAGTIDKFIGDEIMALFGAPVAHEDDPERALRASLEMMDAIEVFNRARGTHLGMHIGVNTGPVVAGSVGAHGRRDYSVMGDAVNLAARLVDASESGEIFVGPATHRRTANLFEFQKIPPVKVKGKEEPVAVHRLVGRAAAPKPTRGIEGLRSSLVGRDKELQGIRSALVGLQRGHGSIVAIVGEAGLGKSRLVAETRALLPENVAWAEGRALSYTAGMSYWLAREILCDLLGLKAEASSVEIGMELRKSVEAEINDQVIDVYPYLSRLFDIDLVDAMEERVKFLGAQALQARILEAFRIYIRARSLRKPLVLIWEDLHWCDPSSLQVLEALLPLTREGPLMVLWVSRLIDSLAHQTVSQLSQKHGADFRRIELSPLTRLQSDSLVRQLLKIENLPEKMRDLILDRAEGNPFFLEELLRSLLDSGIVVMEKDRAIATRELQSVDVPDTLQGVLMARIDRLESEQKQTLQKASVIGRVFQQRVLAYLYDLKPDEQHLDRSLGELQRREFIQSPEQAASETSALQEDEYIFKHSITHEVTYNSLLVASRKELHAKVAQTLETLFPERLDELSATLGYHFERAGAAALATHYLGRAAERAQATFANTEALAFYQSAIVQIHRVDSAKEDSAMRSLAARLNEGLGDVLTLLGQQEDARTAYERARSFVPNTDAVWRSRLFRKTGFGHSVQRHYEETGRAYDSAEKELGDMTSARSVEWWEEKVQIQLERMHLFYWQGMAGEMREVAERYRSAIEERGKPIQRGKFFEKLALSYLTESRYRPTEECLRLAERAFSESRGSGHLPELSHIRFVLGFVHLWRRNYAGAIEHGEAALHLAQRCGDLVTQARCMTYWPWLIAVPVISTKPVVMPRARWNSLPRSEWSNTSRWRRRIWPGSPGAKTIMPKPRNLDAKHWSYGMGWKIPTASTGWHSGRCSRSRLAGTTSRLQSSTRAACLSRRSIRLRKS